MSIRTTCLLSSAGALALCCAFGQTGFAEQSFPRISGAVGIELENDWVTDADDSSAELNNLNMTIEPEVTIEFTKQLGVFAALTFEQVQDPEAGTHSTLEGHGMYLSDLIGFYRDDGFEAFAGKFGPNFSIAYDAAPGIFGSDIAEDDIELSEFIGFGGAMDFGGGSAGTHSLSASLFFQDTTVFSNSAFTSRGDTQKSDGGMGNTELPNNIAVAVDGGEIPGLDGLRYHVGFQRLEPGEGATETDSQYGFAAAVETSIPVGEITLTPLVEYVRYWNRDGVDSQSRHYTTEALSAAYGAYNVAVSHTWRGNRNGDGDSDDHALQLSAGYEFDFGMTADIGYKFLFGEGDTDEQTLGILLTKGFTF